MTARLATVTSLLLLVVLVAQGRAAAPEARTAVDLWTPAQLAEPKGTAAARAERAIRRLPQPDQSPPARTAPLCPAPPLPDAWRGIIRRVALPAHDRRIALTFDLCERSVHVTGYDARLVDALRAGKAKATFFAGGKWLRSHPERALQLMADPDFELGNHAWTHANMAVSPPAERERQVDWTAAQHELAREELDRRLAARGLPASGLGPLALFRLPYGRGGAEVAQFLNGRGLAVIQWDVVGEGGSGSVQERARAIAEAVRPGSIVLLHANAMPRDTAELVRQLLPLLARKGLATATVGELLASGRPEAVQDGYFSFPGDNARYDALFAGHGTGRRLGAPVKRP
ncbi:MAG: polysaccharide deacetylase family protein [Desulfovibrio sp.]